MSTHFCPQCGKKHEYLTVKPRYCAGCKTDMDAAFNDVSIKHEAHPSPAPSLPTRQPSPKPNYRRYTPAMGRTPPYLSKMRHQETEDDLPPEQYDEQGEMSGDPNEYVDPNEVAALVQELSAGLNPSDFVCSPEAASSIKGSDLAKQIMSNSPKQAAPITPAKVTRRKRKGK